MVRSSGKQKSTKLVFVCVVLLGFGLVADYLWASSPYFASYLSDRVPADNSQSTVIIPKQDPHHAGTEPPKIRVQSFLLYIFSAARLSFLCSFGALFL